MEDENTEALWKGKTIRKPEGNMRLKMCRLKKESKRIYWNIYIVYFATYI